MNTRKVGLPSDIDLRASAEALGRAAVRAREVARRTGTGISIRRDGKLVNVTPDELDRLDNTSARRLKR
jgi:hypothetical protein